MSGQQRMRALLIAGGGSVPDLGAIACDFVDHTSDAVELSKTYEYDVALIQVPAKAFEVVGRLRSAGITVPILVTGALSEAEVLRVFDAGADCFVRAPVESVELEAHVRALVRRVASRPEPIAVGPLSIDLLRRRVEVGGRGLELTNSQMLLLEALVLRLGRSVPREKLVDQLYGCREEVPPGGLDETLCKLRKKIRAACGGTNYIRTIRGQGVMLAVPAE